MQCAFLDDWRDELACKFITPDENLQVQFTNGISSEGETRRKRKEEEEEEEEERKFIPIKPTRNQKNS